MIDTDAFAAAWERAWNDHDVEAVLRHFSDDVVFTSPAARRLLEGSDGVVRGKTELRAYWSKALLLIPDLRFRVVGVYAGVDVLVINYENQVGNLVSEVLELEDGLVVRGHGTYLGASENAVGAVED